MCILYSFRFVMQVFLKTKNCKSLASISLLVLANFVICLWSLSGEIWCVDENFAKLGQSASTKVLVQINLENSLQPLIFGEVSCIMGWMCGKKLPVKFATFLHFARIWAVKKLRRGADILLQSAKGRRSLN